MTALNRFPEIRAFAPSRPMILDMRVHFVLAFLRLDVTAGQSLSAAVRVRPRYLNASMSVSGNPYNWNAASVPARASSAYSLWWLLSAPLQHRAVLIWRPLGSSHSTSMSQRGQHGWGGVALIHNNHGFLHVVVQKMHHKPRPDHHPYLTSLHRTCQ